MSALSATPSGEERQRAEARAPSPSLAETEAVVSSSTQDVADQVKALEAELAEERRHRENLEATFRRLTDVLRGGREIFSRLQSELQQLNEVDLEGGDERLTEILRRVCEEDGLGGPSDSSAGENPPVQANESPGIWQALTAPADSGDREGRPCGFSGPICEFSVTDVLQFVNCTHKTGTLRVTSDDVVGVVRTKEGEPIYAELGEKTGFAAFCEIVGLAAGDLEFVIAEAVPEVSNLTETMMPLIIDALRSLDEKDSESSC